MSGKMNFLEVRDFAILPNQRCPIPSLSSINWIILAGVAGDASGMGNKMGPANGEGGPAPLSKSFRKDKASTLISMIGGIPYIDSTGICSIGKAKKEHVHFLALLSFRVSDKNTRQCPCPAQPTQPKSMARHTLCVPPS
ncbi:hypothetical protein ACLOJK_040124 [Asimina triloba]